MPTPIEILMDPVSLIILAIFGGLLMWEFFSPGRQLPKVKGWPLRASLSFISYFYLSSYLPLIWDGFLASYQLVDLSHLSWYAGAIVGFLVYEVILYTWHRTMHASNTLWLGFHQMHHSAERIDTLGSFYLSPLDMVGFTMVGSLSLTVFVGISPQAITVFLLATTFLGIFQHSNVKTPHWLGYIIQRPESHSIHHGKGVHRYNYCDLPLIDMIFGTFKNPKGYKGENGFYQGASARVPEMVLFRDVSRPKQTDTGLNSVSALNQGEA